MFKDEIANYDDGLLQRFLISCPLPAFKRAAEILEANNQGKFSLSVLLYTIKKIYNKHGKSSFEFNTESRASFHKLHDQFTAVVEKANKIDTFIR